MKVTELDLPGVLLLQPRIFADERGSFFEMWNERRYAEAGIPGAFVQDNLSRSVRGVVRGLHYQNPGGQAKLTTVLEGEVWDVVVDVRRESATFGDWIAVTLSASTGRQLYIPAGFAHGFAVLSEEAVFSYKCSDYYAPESEWTIRWDDPSLGIRWPVRDPILSPKDAAGSLVQELPPSAFPPVTG